jgi:carboxypeptidase Taq
MADADLSALRGLWAEIQDLDAIEELLAWDQETGMPAAAGPDRADALASLAGLRHRRLTDPALRELVAVRSRDGLSAVEQAELARIRRRIDRAVAVPEELTRALARASSRGFDAWLEARRSRDFALFAPALEETVRLTREAATIRVGEGSAYAALLDDYEPGLEVAWLDDLFARLGEELRSRTAELPVLASGGDEAAPLYPVDRQRELVRGLSANIGFDFERGRLDPSEHPFCTALSPRDVRLTWRWDESDFRPGLFGVLHETGHGLYEQGLPELSRGSAIATTVSTLVHESQARFWENHVGRSAGFWRGLAASFVEHFPDTPLRTPEAMWQSVNAAARSPIRVDADETTYDLHIAVRYRLERALFEGDLSVRELEPAWDDLYAEVLGLRPRHPLEGVLQDVHWAAGLFGYFPTYTLGNLAAAQLREAMEDELGPIEVRLEQLETGSLLEWLRREVQSTITVPRKTVRS